MRVVGGPPANRHGVPYQLGWGRRALSSGQLAQETEGRCALLYRGVRAGAIVDGGSKALSAPIVLMYCYYLLPTNDCGHRRSERLTLEVARQELQRLHWLELWNPVNKGIGREGATQPHARVVREPSRLHMKMSARAAHMCPAPLIVMNVKLCSGVTA